ncbi:MAG TPA: hypothetical protein DCR97_01005 [Deltaproteobacteria bacterium]|nr:hypothetical protein [Deltaproteobacteria bacterium]
MEERGLSGYKARTITDGGGLKKASAGKGQGLESVLDHVRGRDVGLRMAAIESLAKSPRRYGKVMVRLASAPESDVRALACSLIGDARPAGGSKVLIEKTRDKNPNVREAACAALGKFRGPGAVKHLVQALHDKTWVACAAAASLGEIGGRQALQQLLRVFHEGDSLKATAACSALMAWNDPEVIGEIVENVRTLRGRKRDRFVRTILEDGGKEILDLLRSTMGSDLLTHLHNLINSGGKVPLRLLALATLFRNAEAVTLILGELAKRDPGEEEYSAIIALLLDLHPVWRNNPEDYLREVDARFTLPMIKACALTGTRIDASILLDVFARAPLETKREISKNVTFITEPTAGLVEMLLSDPDHHVRGDAAQATACLGLTDMAPHIERLARKGYRDTRQKALRSLCILDPAAAQALAEEFVKNGTADDKGIYLSAAELMDKGLTYRLVQDLLRSKKHRVASEAVRAMGKLAEQDPRFLAMTGELLSRKRVLPEVLEIIKKYRLTALQPNLLKLQEKLRNDPWLRYQTLSALSAMEDQGLFDVFAAGLQDGHNLVKIGCIKALVRLGQRRAAELISPFLVATDPDLRHAARAAVDTLMVGDNYPLSVGTN